MAFPCTPILDDFDRADNPTDMGVNWADDPFNTAVLPGISSNHAYNPSGVTSASALWKREFYGRNQEAWATLASNPDDGDYYCFARMTPGTNGNGYLANYYTGIGAGTGLVRIYQKTGSSRAQIGTSFTVPTPAAGDSFGIRCFYTWIEGFYRPVGGVWSMVCSGFDSTYNVEGYTGIMLQGGASDGFTEFGGGNIVLAPPEKMNFIYLSKNR